MSDEWVDVATPNGGDEWVDVSTSEPWNLQGAAKNFGAGVIEGLTGTGALILDAITPNNFLSDIFSTPASRTQRHLQQAKELKTKSWVERNLPASVATAQALAPILPENDPTYRYSRRVGQFVGPGSISRAPFTAALSQVLPAIGAQAAADATGDEVLAPLAGAVTTQGAVSLAKGLFNALKRGVMGATPAEIQGSAAKAFKDQTGLTAGQIDQGIALQRGDPLLRFKTTAEITDNAGAAQLEKTLSAADEPARLYNQRGMLRERARDEIIDSLAPKPTSTKEGLGTKLIDAASSERQRMGQVAQDLWQNVPRYEGVEISNQMDDIARMLSTKQGGLPVDKRVMTLVDQFLEQPIQTSGRLQDIRSSALELGRDANIRPSDQRVLNSLQAHIDDAVRMSDNPELYDSWRAARDATAQGARTFQRGTAGGALTQEMARPSNVLSNAIKGDRRSIQEIRAATGNDPELMAQVGRRVLDNIPRDAQGRLTPSRMRNYLQANEGSLSEILGQRHYDDLQNVLSDLQSEARVGEMAFRSSKGGSVTSQRQTVAGAIEDVMLSASTKDMPGWIAKLLTQLKEGAGIRDKLAVRDLLFRASMDPTFARELAATPTRTRILTAFERLGRIGSDAAENAVKSGAIEIGSSTALPQQRSESKKEAGSLASQSEEIQLGKKPSRAAIESESPFSLFSASTGASQAKSSLFNPGGSNAGITNLFGAVAKSGAKKNGGDMALKHETTVAKVMPHLFKAESSNNPKAVGPETKYGTAKGLGQLLDSTGREWHQKLGLPGKYDPFNKEQNAIISAAYYDWLVDQFDGDAKLALAAYNYGIGNVKNKMAKWGKSFKSIYPRLPLETQQYVMRISKNAGIA